jgi:hypothetical protein
LWRLGATSDEVLRRARRLRLAPRGGRAAGPAGDRIGHSIGASTLLGLGGRPDVARTHEGPLPIEHELRLERLALLAPAAGFFMAPGALGQINVPVLAIAASEDAVYPRPPRPNSFAASWRGECRSRCASFKERGTFRSWISRRRTWTIPFPNERKFLERLAGELAAFALQ